MTEEHRQRLQESIRQRLLNHARRENVDFQLVLTRYGLERFLYRLGQSNHRDSFLLKGAFLFLAWKQEIGRPTRDLDLLGHGAADVARLETIVGEILRAEVEEDGLEFNPDSIRGEEIRDAALYDGIRIRLDAKLGRARIPVQIDIGFGDAAGPHPIELEYPTLLDQSPPQVLSYRPEFVVAEKLEALVALGEINTRIKDYFDLWRLGRMMEIPQADLIAAIRATFRNRGTAIPSTLPSGLGDGFADAGHRSMWNAFVERNALDAAGMGFAEVLDEIRVRYWPLLEAASREQSP